MSAKPLPILLTGTNGGLGSALARVLAARGVQLILVDRQRRKLERLCDEIEALGAPAPAYCDMDLANLAPDGASELMAGFEQAYGPLYGLVHAAARFGGLRPLEQTPPDQWLLDIQVNLNASWLLSVAALPQLKRDRGVLAFMLDSAPAQGQAYWGGYGVSKAALASLAAMFADELEGSACRVISLDPGPMRTALRAEAYLAEDPALLPDPLTVAESLATQLLPSD